MKQYNQIKANLVLDFYIDEICKFRKVDKSDVLKKGRIREFADIRKMAAYLAKKQVPSIALAEISVYFELKNHATAFYSINTIETLKTQVWDIKRTLEHCEKLNFAEWILKNNGFESWDDCYFSKRPEGILLKFYSIDNVTIDGYSFSHVQNIDIFDALIISQNIDNNPLGVLINSLKN